VIEDIKACGKRIGEGKAPDAKNELLAMVNSLKEPLDAVVKHAIHMKRGMRVVNHKNAVRANDRLFAALDRMKRDAKSFQQKMDALAASKSAKKG
jgi:hypothetical protein